MLDTSEDDLPSVYLDDDATVDGFRAADTDETSHEAQLLRSATRWFLVSILLGVALLVVGVWDHLDRRERVEAFVQPIRVTDEGQVTLIEPLKRMRDYVVPAEAIQFMLGRFVKDLRRLGKDDVEQEDRRRDVEASVCGTAAQQILRPPVREAALVAVNVEGVLPTESPKTYRISWKEAWADTRGNPVGEHQMIGDFTLNRRDLDWKKQDSMAIYVRNPLSLCVASYVIHEVPYD